MDLKEMFRPPSPEITASCIYYADLLSHLILDSIPGQLEAGHCFKITREHSAGGTHTLLATDSFDGKRYRIMVEPVLK